MPIVCARCGHENPAGVAVCARCAGPLANLCPLCNFENPAGFKFCGNCGANLLTAALTRASDEETLRRLQGYIPGHLVEKILRVGKQIEGERRTVTVLFSDVVGFTTISERLDPEHVYAIIDACVTAFRDEIYKHEGTLDKFMGDGVMALFGAPVAHEDDPARALRCALGMQEALKKINRDLVAQHGVTLQIRIGLNLGTVVVGDIGSDLRMNYTALGDSVNVASRLQSVAEPGTILASRAVYDQTRPLFEFRELGSIRVKGRVEPVEIFEAVGPRREPGQVRGIPGLSAPMVGREKEFELVKRLADALLEDRRGAALLLTGEAGIGKSRLTAELKQYVQNRAVRVCEGGAFAYGQQAYGPFVKLLTSLFGLRPDDSEAEARHKIETRVRAVLAPEQVPDVLPYIFHLLPVRIVERELEERIRNLDPAQRRRQIFLAVRDLIVAYARREPLLLILEDLHWADKLSLDLLLFLFSAVESVPLWLYCTSRPADNAAAPQIQRVGESALGEQFTLIALQPLSPTESAALVNLLLTSGEAPEALRRLIPQRAEGNPFYLEEIIRMLIDRQLIRRAGERWEAAPGADFTTLEVPRTLEGLIMARVDNLPESTRNALQCASVIGRDFAGPLLERIANGRAAQLETDLQDLSDHELIELRAERPERQYAFRHILFQQTVYNSLLMRRREELHHRIAAGIESLYFDRLEEQVEQLAFHYTESKDAARALPYLLRAGDRAASRFANEAALEYYRTALDLANPAKATLEQRVALLSGQGSTQSFVGDYDGALDSLRAALELARAAPETSGQARQCAELARQLGRVYDRRGQANEALRWLETAQREVDRDPDSARAVERARIYLDTGWVHYHRGNLEEAYWWRMRSLQISEECEYYPEMGSAYNGLAVLFIDKNDLRHATEFARRGLALRERIGDTEGIARSQSNLGIIAAVRGDWDEASEHFRRSLEIRQRLGQAKGLANAYANLGRVYVLKGDTAQAREYLGAGLRVAEKIHDPEQLCLALNGLAEAEVHDGRWPEAISNLQRSLETAAASGGKEQLSHASRILAEAQLGAGNIEEAASYAHHALQLAQDIGVRQTEASAYRVLGQIAREQKRWREAEDNLARSLALFVEMQNHYEAARVEFDLALLYRAQGMELDARALFSGCCETFARLGVESYRRRAEAALGADAILEPDGIR